MSAAQAETESKTDAEVFPPPDTTSPQLTLRAVLTGMLLGGVLSLCNIYSGLKIGWGFNMSITACLLGWAFWQGLHAVARTRSFGALENNINQTAASSAASVSSAGLVAGIPALTMLTGYEWRYPILASWVFVVCLVGIVVAIGLRKQMIVVDRLPFPNGIATATTVTQMYAKGSDAMRRVVALLVAALLAGTGKLLLWWKNIHNLAFPGSYAAPAPVASEGIRSVTLANLGFSLDPSPLMVAVGGLVGLRAAISVTLGALIAWGVLGPWALANGWAHPGPNEADTSWYGPMLKWLLWPGVGMMVAASLTSFAFSWRSIAAALAPRKKTGATEDLAAAVDVPRKVYLIALASVLVAATSAQVAFFGIQWWTAALGVLMTFVLAIVAGRVTGETNVTPVGAMGKVTQLVFGVVEPGRAAANLMSATVTGGAASQCADLLHDLKTGALIGGSPRAQAVAQTAGSLAGAVMGCAGYLLIMPDPARQVGTDAWPAPAVQSWKAVAEIFMRGLSTMPPHALEAMAIGAAIGIVLALMEKLLPKSIVTYVPSPSSLGLGFVIPAYNAISILIGALIALVAERVDKRWAAAFVVVIAAGLIAGESLVGVGLAIYEILRDALAQTAAAAP
ncbi:MAG: OPT/YSL family transporter [Sandaracinaceae bacterium]|nr:OPT/YSL family transporter [Sandaracinaceae bacterium]